MAVCSRLGAERSQGNPQFKCVRAVGPGRITFPFAPPFATSDLSGRAPGYRLRVPALQAMRPL